MKKVKHYHLNLSRKAIEDIKMIRYDADYFIRELAGLSDFLIDEALDSPTDCTRKLEYLSMLGELRTLIESLQEKGDPAKLQKRLVKQPPCTDS